MKKKFIGMLFCIGFILLSISVCYADTLKSDLERGNVTAETLSRYMSVSTTKLIELLKQEQINYSYKINEIILSDYDLEFRFDKEDITNVKFGQNVNSSKKRLLYNDFDLLKEDNRTVEKFKDYTSTFNLKSDVEYDITWSPIAFDMLGTTVSADWDILGKAWLGPYFFVSQGSQSQPFFQSEVKYATTKAKAEIPVPMNGRILKIDISNANGFFIQWFNPVIIEILGIDKKSLLTTTYMDTSKSGSIIYNIPNSYLGKKVYLNVRNMLDPLYTVKFNYRYGFFDFDLDVGGEIRGGATTLSIPKSLPVKVYKSANLDPLVSETLDEAINTWNDVWEKYGYSGKLFEYSTSGVLVMPKPLEISLKNDVYAAFGNIQNNIYINTNATAYKDIIKKQDKIKMQYVLTHELGHALGLNDLYIKSQDKVKIGGVNFDNRDKLMYGYTEPGRQNPIVPTIKEIRYLKSLHKNTPYITSNTSPQADQPTMKQITIHSEYYCSIVGEKDGWIYYYSDNNYILRRVRTDGTGDMLVRNYSPHAVICSNWIFFSNRSDEIGDLYRMNMDGSGEFVFQEGNSGYYSKGESSIEHVVSFNDTLFFIGQNKENVSHLYKTTADIFDRKDLYAFDSLGYDNVRQVLVDGQWVYMVTDNSLYRINSGGNEGTKTEKSDMHNFDSSLTIQNEKLFLANWYEGAIYSMGIDMKNRKKIAPIGSPSDKIIGESKGWIFYSVEKTSYNNGNQSKTNSFYKISNNGTEKIFLFSCGSYMDAFVKDNYIYVTDGKAIIVAKIA